jgi:hypothetical protein
VAAAGHLATFGQAAGRAASLARLFADAIPGAPGWHGLCSSAPTEE